MNYIKIFQNPYAPLEKMIYRNNDLWQPILDQIIPEGIIYKDKKYNGQKTNIEIIPFSYEALPDTFYRYPYNPIIEDKHHILYPPNDNNYYWAKEQSEISPDVSRYDKKNVESTSTVNRYVIDKSTGDIYMEKHVDNPHISLSTKGLGFIGGDKNEVRNKFLSMINASDFAKQIGQLYGIDPNLLLRRMSVEGVIDKYITEYNRYSNKSQQQNIVESFYNDNIHSSFGDWGLDTVLDQYINGKLQIKDDNVKQYLDDIIKNKKYIETVNEAGFPSKSFMGNANVMMHLMAAYFNYLKNTENKYIQSIDLPESMILNAFYNRGIQGAKDYLSKHRDEFIKKYNVSNHYKNGGKINYLNLFK